MHRILRIVDVMKVNKIIRMPCLYFVLLAQFFIAGCSGSGKSWLQDEMEKVHDAASERDFFAKAMQSPRDIKLEGIMFYDKDKKQLDTKIARSKPERVGYVAFCFSDSDETIEHQVLDKENVRILFWE